MTSEIDRVIAQELGDIVFPSTDKNEVSKWELALYNAGMPGLYDALPPRYVPATEYPSRRDIDLMCNSAARRCASIFARPAHLAGLGVMLRSAIAEWSGVDTENELSRNSPAHDQTDNFLVSACKQVREWRASIAASARSPREADYRYAMLVGALVATYNQAVETAEQNDRVYRTQFALREDGSSRFGRVTLPSGLAKASSCPHGMSDDTPVIMVNEQGYPRIVRYHLPSMDEIATAAIDAARASAPPERRYAVACAVFVVGVARRISGRPFDNSITEAQAQTFELHASMVRAAMTTKTLQPPRNTVGHETTPAVVNEPEKEQPEAPAATAGEIPEDALATLRADDSDDGHGRFTESRNTSNKEDTHKSESPSDAPSPPETVNRTPSVDPVPDGIASSATDAAHASSHKVKLSCETGESSPAWCPTEEQLNAEIDASEKSFSMPPMVHKIVAPMPLTMPSGVAKNAPRDPTLVR